METNELFLKTNIVARINNANILASRVAEQLVPVKPLCTALGVSYQTQQEKLRNHPLFSSVITLRVTTGADKKRYEMLCLPVKYVFGWIFTIHPDNVKESVRDSIIKYQEECCDALYNYFFITQIKRQESFGNTITLQNRKKELEDKPDKSEDLTEYIDVNKQLKDEKSIRRKNTRIEINGNMLFSEKDMKGKNKPN